MDATTKKTTSKAKAGRPTLYTPGLADKICSYIATSTHGIQRLCKLHDDMPDYKTIFNWLINKPEFAEKYEKAKSQQANILFDLMLELIDKPETYVDDSGQERNDVAILRLKVDTIKWQLTKLQPKKYSDKIDIASSGDTVKELSMLKVENQVLKIHLENRDNGIITNDY